MTDQSHASAGHDHGFTNRVVKIFLESNLSIILILLAAVVGLAALGLTPREEDPQIVVPLADVYVNFPGHSAAEVEQLVATPLEKILYQIDGVEYVYSMSRPNQAIITVRYYVGEDRERSLVKLYKKIDEHLDVVPPGVAGWVVKPVEIDDVPVATLTLAGKAAGKGGQAPFAGTALRGLRPKGACPLFRLQRRRYIRRGGHAGRGADHHRPDLLGPGVVADLRPVRLHALHPVRDPCRVLAPVREQAGARDAAIGDGRRGSGRAALRPTRASVPRTPLSLWERGRG